MQPREDALRRQFAQQPCKNCHARHAPESLLILVRRARTWVVMAACANCHHRGMYMVSFPHAEQRALGLVSAHATITTRDVIEMHGFLEHFDGDFLGLFGKGPRGHFAAE